MNIFNSIGQVVYSKSVLISKGISTETFDVNNLSNGYYHLQLKNNIHNINHQFCKQ
ncbi:MAG: hypothetical protein IPL95_12760 [Saprospiraceae bacterium]|nr:hypothetical protein [Saprospiraceae bacterium]